MLQWCVQSDALRQAQGKLTACSGQGASQEYPVFVFNFRLYPEPNVVLGFQLRLELR
jgi:hypothetical protein